ncbi:MAG: phosphoribosylformylglycinamidine synthase subunit PurS [Candidatus Nitrosocosmicus sp.]
MDKLNKNKEHKFMALVNIENKSFLNDPEGETILNDLILRGGYNNITSVRTAKSLKIELFARDIGEAKAKVKEMCDDLRIFNPIVSDCQISVKKIVFENTI